MPGEWDYQGWKKFFAAAALWNASGSIPGILFPGLSLKLFYGVSAPDHITLFLNRGLWWAVLIFGIGYLIIATDPAGHWGIIVMGIIGKCVVALNWVWLWIGNEATLMALFAAMGDSIFTIYFIYYLARGPRDTEAAGTF